MFACQSMTHCSELPQQEDLRSAKDRQETPSNVKNFYNEYKKEIWTVGTIAAAIMIAGLYAKFGLAKSSLSSASQEKSEAQEGKEDAPIDTDNPAPRSAAQQKLDEKQIKELEAALKENTDTIASKTDKIGAIQTDASYSNIPKDQRIQQIGALKTEIATLEARTNAAKSKIQELRGRTYEAPRQTRMDDLD